MLSLRPALLAAAVAIAAVIATGCSWVSGTSRAPAYDTRGEPDCVESRAAPIADTIVALAAAGMIVAVAADHEGCSDDELFSELCQTVTAGVMVSSVLTGSLFTASAVHGYRGASRCRKADAIRLDHVERPRPTGPPGSWRPE